MQDVCADCQITIIEGVDSAPTLGTKFLAAYNQGVEIAQGEEAGFEFVWLFVTFLDESLVKVGVGSS